jgi:uncharacterized membrane protein YbaN (DUF454 family)
VEPASTSHGLRRWVWFVVGWMAVGLGGLGVLVPGLPTTVFFIVAASCFARSSPRFERWVLDRPGVGPLVGDYRAGLGMPRRSKQWAVAMIMLSAGVSAVLSSRRPLVSAVIVAAATVGICYVVWRVPTREKVLALRAETPGSESVVPRDTTSADRRHRKTE